MDITGALSIIHNACEQPVQEKYIDAKNAKEAWDTLMTTYEAETASVINRLLDESGSAKKKPTETCWGYFARVKAISDERVLSGLPKEYDQLRVALGMTDILIEEAINEALQNEERRIQALNNAITHSRSPRSRHRSTSRRRHSRSPRSRYRSTSPKQSSSRYRSRHFKFEITQTSLKVTKTPYKSLESILKKPMHQWSMTAFLHRDIEGDLYMKQPIVFKDGTSPSLQTQESHIRSMPISKGFLHKVGQMA